LGRAARSPLVAFPNDDGAYRQPTGGMDRGFGQYPHVRLTKSSVIMV
jgi:hypothetical protein